MNYKFDWNDTLKVVKIENEDKAKHLKEYIGQTGEMINRISLNKYKRKYKLRFKDGSTHYFKEEEVEKINQ